MEYKINTNSTAQYSLNKTSGANYEAIRMLRLKFAGTTAEEKYQIIQEFKLNEEYKEITNLKLKKEAFENELTNLKNKKQLTENNILETTESPNELNNSIDDLKKSIEEIKKTLNEKDSESLSVKEYYEKIVPLLFAEVSKIEFKDIDIAEVNKGYNDFFFILSGNTANMKTT